MISDLERTIVDGLKQPLHVGGITEVAKGLWMKHEQINVEKLIIYARKFQSGAVIRRLGYLLELYGLANTTQLKQLTDLLTMTTQRLDPTLPAEGRFVTRWRLQLNVTPEELRAIRIG